MCTSKKMLKRAYSLKWQPLLLSALMVMATGVKTSGQEQDTNSNDTLIDKSLEKLTNIEVVSTATLTKTTPRLVPAAVITITAEQIQVSGDFRDLAPDVAVSVT